MINCTRQIYYGFQHSAAMYKCKAWLSVKFPLPGRFLFKQKNIAISQTARGQPIKSPHLTPSPCHIAHPTTPMSLSSALQPICPVDVDIYLPEVCVSIGPSEVSIHRLFENRISVLSKCIFPFYLKLAF